MNEGVAINRGPGPLPPAFESLVDRFPGIARAHLSFARAADVAGNRDARSISSGKNGICIGAGLESAFRSRVRRGLAHGLTPQDIAHAIGQAVNTPGLPRTVKVWRWARQEFARPAVGGD